MDRTVPAGAALLLDRIREIETGRKDASAYDVIYAHKQALLPKPTTQMTIAELQDHQANRWPAKSTAAGAYQFMRATLGDLRKELGLRDGQVFDANLQDRLGYHLLKRRGYEQFMADKISVTEFGKRLAQEWASFPVLAPVRGSSRDVVRGQSYYAGDGLNKALVKPEAIEALLLKAKATGNGPVSVPPQPDIDHYPEQPQTPAESTARVLPKALIVIAVIVILALIGAFFFVRF